MWFEEDDLIGKRLFMARHRKRKAMLKVNAKVNSGGLLDRFKVAVVVSALVAVVGTCVLIWFGVKKMEKMLFSANDRFKISHLSIITRPGAKLTKDRIAEYAGIQKGINMFDFSINAVRKRFLKHQPNVRTMEIRRRLPGTVEIEVVEREPLARLGRNGSYGVDEEGFVFVAKSMGILPVLEGGSERQITPGGRLSGRSLAALRVIDCCNNPIYGINIKAVEMDHHEYLSLHLMSGKVVKFNWHKMGAGTEESRKELVTALRRLTLLLRSDEGKRKNRIDATFGSRMYAQR